MLSITGHERQAESTISGLHASRASSISLGSRPRAGILLISLPSGHYGLVQTSDRIVGDFTEQDEINPA